MLRCLMCWLIRRVSRVRWRLIRARLAGSSFCRPMPVSSPCVVIGIRVLPVAAVGLALSSLLRAEAAGAGAVCELSGTSTALRATIGVMATPEPPQELLDRLTRAEDAVQRFEFIHLVKTDAQTAGLGILYAQQQRMQHDLAGFRAEVAAEFEAFKTDVAAEFGAVRTELTDIKTTLAEILRRLPGE